MRRKARWSLVVVSVSAILGWLTGAAIPEQPAPVQEVAKLQKDAAAVAPLVRSSAAKAFLGAIAELPEMGPRLVYRDKERTRAYTPAEYEALPEAEREGLERREYDNVFYYETAYGTPVIYARPLDLVAAHGLDGWEGRRIFDFGYGAVGHLRMLAACGADVVGVEAEPVFRALYSRPEDQGVIRSTTGLQGRLTLVHGRYPAEEHTRATIGGGYDLIVSKNVLKRGYIHPERPADEEHLVRLGVDDDVFVRALFEALKPGGLVMIYNLAPAQAPPDQPYIPWADGRCPFPREQLEEAGFEVVAYDTEDTPAALDLFMALGYDRGEGREALAKDLFAHYTLLRRPR